MLDGCDDISVSDGTDRHGPFAAMAACSPCDAPHGTGVTHPRVTTRRDYAVGSLQGGIHMLNFVSKKSLVSALLVAGLWAASSTAHADTLVRFNFNSNPADNNTSTGTIAPSFGAGTAALVGVTGSFSSGTANGGSSDPAATDNSGWQTLNYAAQGAGDKTRGVQFSVDTTGYSNIVFGYDIRHSNTSSKWEQVQYTLNGSSFIDFATFSVNAGDTWANGRLVDFSSVSGASNNALFGVRVVATFAPSTTAFAPSTLGSTYGGGGNGGTWRFDSVSVNGNAIAAVPEPEGVLLGLAGMAALALVSRRKQAA
jgi:hypothetical protein